MSKVVGKKMDNGKMEGVKWESGMEKWKSGKVEK